MGQFLAAALTVVLVFNQTMHREGLQGQVQGLQGPNWNEPFFKPEVEVVRLCDSSQPQENDNPMCSVLPPVTASDPKLPHHVHVGKSDYRMRYGCDPDEYGATWYKQKVICIRPGLDKAMFRHVILHELMHAAANEECGKACTGGKKRSSDDWIEIVVDKLARALAENPELVRLLTDK